MTLEYVQTAGYPVTELLEAGVPVSELLQSGLSIRDFNGLGDISDLALSQLIESGYPGTDLRGGGFLAAELVKHERFKSVAALLDAGYSLKECSESLGRVYSIEQLVREGCHPRRLREIGYTAAELSQTGVTLPALVDAGFPVHELKRTFSFAAIFGVGLDLRQLRLGGFSAADLRSAKVSISELNDAGYTISDLRMVPLSAAQLIDAGLHVTATDLRSAGYTAKEIVAAKVGMEELKAAGFSKATLETVEWNMRLGSDHTMSKLLEAQAAGISVDQVYAAGFSAAQVCNQSKGTIVRARHFGHAVVLVVSHIATRLFLFFCRHERRVSSIPKEYLLQPKQNRPDILLGRLCKQASCRQTSNSHNCSNLGFLPRRRWKKAS